MQTDFIYQKKVVGSGNMPQTPRTGDFFDINGVIYRVEAVMFKVIPYSMCNNVNAKVYLVDVMPATEEKLKYC